MVHNTLAQVSWGFMAAVELPDSVEGSLEGFLVFEDSSGGAVLRVVRT